MSDYRIYPAPNRPLATMTVFSPQCRSEGVKATRRDFTGDGSLFDQGLYVELVWQLLPLSKYTTILTACGLVSVAYIDVTVYCRDDQYAYHRYNGRAIRPQPSWGNSFVRNLVILVRDLEFIS